MWIPNIKLPKGTIYYSGENMFQQNKDASCSQSLLNDLSVVAESDMYIWS